MRMAPRSALFPLFQDTCRHFPEADLGPLRVFVTELVPQTEHADAVESSAVRALSRTARGRVTDLLRVPAKGDL
jgi:hypothetical protein